MRYILLEKMGLKEEDLKGKHVVAYAYDADFQGKHFEVSVPCEHVLDPTREVTLVYESNGEALPKEHGFPLRMLTPGCIAVRSPKWVNRIFISDEEADHASQRRDYKIVTDAEISQVKWDQHKPVYAHPINSGVGYPVEGTSVSGHQLEIKGWAHGEGNEGTQATRVEVSIDGGQTWRDADEYVMEEKPAGQKVWSWTLWKLTVDTSCMRGDLNL